MKIAATLAALGIALFTTGQAMAQSEQACADIKKALPMTQEAVKALRGAPMKAFLSSEEQYAAKISIAGFADCTLASTKEKGTYWEHHLQCSRVFPDGQNDAAFAQVEDLTRCLGEVFSDRAQHQKYVNGTYRTDNFSGSVTPQGRDVIVRYGDTDYALFRAEIGNALKLEVDLHIYYSFLKP